MTTTVDQLDSPGGAVTRRSFLGTAASGAAAGGLATLSAGCGNEGEGGAARQPNILMIVSDDQGFGDLGCYGNPVLKTPHLDGLFGQSTRLTNYCVSPLCAPTRAALMTGRHEYLSGVSDTGKGNAMLREEAVTFPSLLREAGYRTGLFNKWHLGNNYPSRPQDKGFDLVCSTGRLPEHRSRVTVNGETREVDRFHDDSNTDEAIRFMTEQGQQPFFAFVASKLPHDVTPPMAPPSFVQPYLDAGLTAGDAEVYGMIADLDQNVGRLLQSIDEARIADDTVVIFFPDNGPLRNCPDMTSYWERDVVSDFDYTRRFNMGLRGGKTLVYEGGIRVPCFVRWPQQFQAGRDVSALSAHVDWLPTLLDIAGTKPPDEPALDGRSLLPLLRGAQEGWTDERTLVFQSHRVDVPQPWVNACVRGERFKLVNGDELYDLDADPGEQQNTAEDNPGKVEQYRQFYDDWYENVCRENNQFEPSHILVGTDAQSTIRCPRTNIHSKGWRFRVVRGGAYELTVESIKPEMFGQNGALVFSFGDQTCHVDVSPGADQVTSSITLDEGDGYLTVEAQDLTTERNISHGTMRDLGFRGVMLRASHG